MAEDKSNGKDYIPLALISLVAIVAIVGILVMLSGNDRIGLQASSIKSGSANTAGQMYYDEWYGNGYYDDGGDSSVVSVTMRVGCIDASDLAIYEKDKSFLSNGVALDWGKRFCGFTPIFLQRNVVCSVNTGQGLTVWSDGQITLEKSASCTGGSDLYYE